MIRSASVLAQPGVALASKFCTRAPEPELGAAAVSEAAADDCVASVLARAELGAAAVTLAELGAVAGGRFPIAKNANTALLLP